MEYITDILYWISSGLLVPVIVILIFLFLRSLILIGSFFGQYISVRKNGGHTPLGLAYTNKVKKAVGSKAEIKRLLAQFEIEADKDLSTSKMLSKLGPMLGLMGTLIPMGPALAGLSSGDIESMARNMQVAFATTVTGLVAAAIGYVTQQIKQRWYLKDMTELEYLSETKDKSDCNNSKY
ncbi:MAG: MotA/TolQ/ExbB proton channel family protein [Prevotella sp.]